VLFVIHFKCFCDVFFSENMVLNLNADNVQYIRWSPVDHAAVWVVENDIYFSKNVEDPNSTQRLTSNGEKNKIFNGIPDWVYEGQFFLNFNH